ncbi:amino acid permease [Halorarum halophilum]|uniref:Amino acid permease n=1 Tax=Halorarum halophilum TaxID=2743090 RepID=A0A7D5GKE7_9EURY|nr:amino acid permease [Halobaculum halophilum]QLG27424.1 amino acid permease [Halobaculum halophilum]
MSTDTDIAESKGLAKQLGFWHLWAIGVGSVVGDGIFLLLGDGIATAGPAAILAYVLAGLFMLFIALAVSDLAVGLPSAGAMWIWGREILGDYAGFISGLSYAVGWIIAGGSVGLAMGRITQFFVPDLGVPAAVWGILFVTIFALIQLGGVFLSSRLQLGTVLLLVGIVLIFGISTILSGNYSGTRFTPFFPNGYGSVWAAMAFGMYAYMGPLTLTTGGDEAKNVEDIPRALVVACVTFLFIYTLAMIGMIGIMGYEQFTSLESPFTTTAQMVWGSNAALIINFAAWIAAFTSLFMGTMYSAPRMLYKMGEMKVLPDIFGQVYEGTRVPLFSTVFVWACSVVLLLVAQYELLDYGQLSLLLVFAWLVTWGVAIVAAVKYRREHPGHVAKQNWKQPLFPLFPVLGMLGVAFILYGTFSGAAASFGLGIVFLIAISAIYYFYGRHRMDNAEIPTVLDTDRQPSTDD